MSREIKVKYMVTVNGNIAYFNNFDNLINYISNCILLNETVIINGVTV